MEDRFSARVCARLVLCACAMAASAVQAAESGWWWNPARAGQGFSIEVQSGELFMAGYLYTDEGRATWLVSSGAMSDANNYRGPLLGFGGGQTLGGAYHAPAPRNPSPGTIALSFTDERHGTLTWPGGSMPIERFVFSPGAASTTVQPVWWWYPDESGRGFAIEVQGDTMVMAGYMYDESGEPTWYLSSGAMSSPTQYNGTWLKFSGGQSLTGPYRAPAAPTEAGAVAVRFTASGSAMLTLPGAREVSLTRFRFGASDNFDASRALAARCVAPRAAGTLDPFTGAPYGDVQGTLLDENKWIRAYVDDGYLWYRDVPAVDPASYFIGASVPYVDPGTNRRSTVQLTTAEVATDAYFNSQRTQALATPSRAVDRFHFTLPTPEWIQLATNGTTVGFGFEPALIQAAPPRDIRIAFVQPGSPAAAAGLRRGTQFRSVNGSDVVSGNNVALINEALFAPVSGRTYQIQVQDPNSTTRRTVSLTAGPVASAPVIEARTLAAPYEDVGYIVFNEHSDASEAALIDAVNRLEAANGGAGVADLVLDLRYNGGGLLDVASELAYMIAGSTATRGKTFERLITNDKNPFALSAADAATPFYDTARGHSAPFGQPLPQLGLRRVYVLASDATCSASEAVINGLRGIGIEVRIVGYTTCGKPYGFSPQDNCGTTYFAVQFKGVNEAGFGDYADGIPADCPVGDDLRHELGDPNEAQLAVALRLRASGQCSGAIAAKEQIVEAAPKLVRPPWRTSRIVRTTRD